jgi:hypothetical protein
MAGITQENDNTWLPVIFMVSHRFTSLAAMLAFIEAFNESNLYEILGHVVDPAFQGV